jgi:hypothetical protein
VETAREDGGAAQVVFKLDRNVSAAALEHLCTKARLDVSDVL